MKEIAGEAPKGAPAQRGESVKDERKRRGSVGESAEEGGRSTSTRRERGRNAELSADGGQWSGQPSQEEKADEGKRREQTKDGG